MAVMQRVALIPLPETVDPDAWLPRYHNRADPLRVDSRGAIQLWKHTYYVGRAYTNQTVLVRLDAQQRAIHIEQGKPSLKTISLKGLYGKALDYLDFLGFMCDEARSEWKYQLWRRRLKALAKLS